MFILCCSATVPLFHHDHADNDGDDDHEGRDPDKDAPGQAGVATRLVKARGPRTVSQLVLLVARVHQSRSSAFD